ncbi:hypothetical protein SSX86_025839 [Deinandra increscens subsp. villosa]|uniref:G protein gamma domain-containing protein n=1 Tax=Deinandra increscens subsp. villosa TaxID=3103831 RepID=A0AAP0CE29_9ASTR
MGGTSNDSSASSSMSPPLTVSSPSTLVYLDLYGKRRQLAKLQVLHREIGLLQDEINSLAELELASRCCKELEDYVEATPDPLIAINQIRGRSRKNRWRKIGWMLRCCCCCSKEVRCSFCPRAKDCCCWGGQPKTCSSRCCKCPKISCGCSCSPKCLKISACCWNPCPCF